jgi:D-alanine-D-alanine ligase-like ATP-grasp enzyme
MPLVTSIIQKIAPQIGAVVVIEPEYELVGHITFKNGKKVFFTRSKFNINGLGSSEIAKDKGYSKFFLKHFGYKVTEGETFFNDKLCEKIGDSRNIHAGFEYAKSLGFPVFIKPINLSQGKLVAKIHNKTEYYQVAKKIFKICSGLIVERFYLGKDYRIVVIDDEIIAVYQRLPLSVIGDGKSTILELIQYKQRVFFDNFGKRVIDLDDWRIKHKLQKQRLNLASVIPNGKIIYLLDNANLSNGGEAIDFTDSIHPDFKKLAFKIAKDMGLRLIGLDVITSDITRPMTDYVIIEVNSAPGLDHYASIGDTQAQKVEDLYLKVLKALEVDSTGEN